MERFYKRKSLEDVVEVVEDVVEENQEMSNRDDFDVAQLDNYIFDFISNKEFEELNDLSALAQKLVLTNKNRAYPLVYKLLTLTLILPVATATVEKVFSAMNIVKDRLRNQIGDEWMSDSLVVYVEKDIFLKIDNELILQRYQSMKTRKKQL